MGNCSKKLLCCSQDGTMGDVQQGLQNPPQGPSPQTPPTLQDRINFFKETAKTLNIDALIQAIDQMLKSKSNLASPSTSTTTPQTPSGSTDLVPNCTSAISSGATFLGFVNEHTEKIDAKDDFFVSGQGQIVVGEILQQLGQLHWIVGGLSIIAYLLDKVEKVSQNRSECVELLKCMFKLANHINDLKDHLAEPEQKLKDVFLLIVEGCMTCSSQLDSGNFSSFLKSSVNSEALSNLSSKINRLYDYLILTTGREILTTSREILTTTAEIRGDQVVVLPPLPPAYPEGKVGLKQPLEELKKLFHIKTTEILSRVVVISGFGGIGKTTLANALVATLADDLKDHKYTEVGINEDPAKNDFKSMQEQILRDCFPTYQSGTQISVTNCEQGRRRLKDAFNCGTNKPVFIFIDNALRSDDLKELLPEDLGGLPCRSRILVTTRNLAETDMFLDCGIPRHHYAVNPLAKEHALQVLCNDPTHLDQIRNHAEKIIRIAGGIPLVLKIVGARLRKQKYKVENCTQILNALEHGGDVREGNLSERVVDFVYNGLELSTKEAFLDICFCFNGWLLRHVEYIVGVEEVTALLEAALVTSLPAVKSVEELGTQSMCVAGEERVSVHDVIQARGRSMGESTRVKDCSRATNCQGIKGIQLDDYEVREIEEIQLSRMSDSLRILSLGSGIRISGRSSNTFQQLRYLELGYGSRCLTMNLEGHPCLSFYRGPMLEEVGSKLPQNLKYLKILETYSDVDERPCLEESKSNQAVRNSSLEELDLSRVKNMRAMLDGRFHFDALKILWLCRWDTMKELPPQVCGLPSLNKLILEGCRSLKRVPASIANLRALTHLDLSECSDLEEVSSGVGELTSLRYLDLGFCFKLVKLPDNFGQLSALEYLSLTYCQRLEELPESFAQLRSLKVLRLTACRKLKELPSNFVQLPSVEVLWMFEVHHLLEGFDQINKNWKIIA